jgi:hypothetical protein
MSNISVNTITDASGGSTASINGLTPQASNMQPFNRIINGAMTIDQRNAGASVAGDGVYTLDRWYAQSSANGKYTVQQNAGSVTPPAGFTNYLGVTSSSAYSVSGGENFSMLQATEGYNIADLNWGSANAKTITISFWVRSSLTGTFGGSLQNSAQNRSYPFTYTISSANTWEQKSITVAGDTSGTWLTTNGAGIYMWIGLGVASTASGTAGSWAGANYTGATGATSVVGTSGATFYITGVQLEAGSTASSFAHENYADTLQKCQRYYQRISDPTFGVGYNETTSQGRGIIAYARKRAIPSVSSDAASVFCNVSTGGTVAATSLTFDNQSLETCRYICTSGNTALIDGGASLLQAYSGTPSIYIHAEL